MSIYSRFAPSKGAIPLVGRSFRASLLLFQKSTGHRHLRRAVAVDQATSASLIGYPFAAIYSALFQLCIEQRVLEEGRKVHAHLKRSNFTPGVFISNRIIEFYCKCERPSNARQVFDEMGERDLCSWNILIFGYAKAGLIEDAKAGLIEDAKAGLIEDAKAGLIEDAKAGLIWQGLYLEVSLPAILSLSRVAGSLAAQQSHRAPSSPLAVSLAASPSASSVALKEDRSSDDATTGNLASPSSATVPSGCIASAPHVQRPTKKHRILHMFSASKCSWQETKCGAIVKALLAFAAPDGAKIKATTYHPSPIRLSTEWVASQFFDVAPSTSSKGWSLVQHAARALTSFGHGRSWVAFDEAPRQQRWWPLVSPCSSGEGSTATVSLLWRSSPLLRLEEAKQAELADGTSPSASLSGASSPWWWLFRWSVASFPGDDGDDGLLFRWCEAAAWFGGVPIPIRSRQNAAVWGGGQRWRALVLSWCEPLRAVVMELAGGFGGRLLLRRRF
nr:pentatricopeptide repeat-containing protein At4g37170 [Ipomoea batatas]